MRILIIGNPIAGGGRAAGRIDELAALLRGRGHEVVTFLTAARGDAAERAGRIVPADAAIDRLVVVGGDGTLNEVINGLVDPSAVPIAPWPMGTANVLGHELRLPRRTADVAELIERGRVRRLDMGTLGGGRRFLMLASVGFDAMVVHELERHRLGRLGYRGYVRPIWRTLRAYAPPVLRVAVDGAEPIEGAMVIVSNVRNYGGLFCVADRAVCDSGRLDVCVFQRGRIRDLLRYSFAALRGRVSKLGDVTYLSGCQITIDADVPVPVEADGDACGHTPVTIRLTPAVAPILTPGPPG